MGVQGLLGISPEYYDHPCLECVYIARVLFSCQEIR